MPDQNAYAVAFVFVYYVRCILTRARFSRICDMMSESRCFSAKFDSSDESFSSSSLSFPSPFFSSLRLRSFAGGLRRRVPGGRGPLPGGGVWALGRGRVANRSSIIRRTNASAAAATRALETLPSASLYRRTHNGRFMYSQLANSLVVQIKNKYKP